jgi:hypothetical protein
MRFRGAASLTLWTRIYTDLDGSEVRNSKKIPQKPRLIALHEKKTSLRPFYPSKSVKIRVQNVIDAASKST